MVDPLENEDGPRWKPLPAIERRIVGVLVEKAKTTPDQYPLTAKALCTGCNQKSNRHPIMQLEADRVEDALDNLRSMGAVVEVHGSGRTARYKHTMYKWLGVEKVELAVMAELLLRGAQTVGELRGRAARMEPIPDLGTLNPILDGLEAKRLVVFLSPEGRGRVVSHALCEPHELDKLQRQSGSQSGSQSASMTGREQDVRQGSGGDQLTPELRGDADEFSPNRVHELRTEIDALKAELNEFRERLVDVQSDLETTTDKLRTDLDEICRQLGI